MVWFLFPGSTINDMEHLFADNMIVYLENPKESTEKLLQSLNEFNKVTDISSTYKNHFIFITNNEK